MEKDKWEDHFKLWSTIILMVLAGLALYWMVTHSGQGG